MSVIYIYTDGACEVHNSKIGGWGAVLQYKDYEKKIELGLDFSDKQQEGIQEIQSKVEEGLEVMIQNLQKWNGQVKLAEAKKTEKKINKIRDKLRTEHMKSLEKKEYGYTGGLIYYNIFIYLERVGDHAVNVSEAIAGEVA